ncbi:MAG: hypothetical protein U5J95_09365 [Balneolaceae bacterium]|nr:hypothetical protein [Balneolaceae bacterium]
MDTLYSQTPKFAAKDSSSYSVLTENHQLQVNISEELCTDSMNGAEFPLSVIVNLDGKEYRGCGKFL